MRVLVLGSGVVGVATAWYLSKAGLEVEVVDRQSGPGLETSFANGGQISACHNEPLASPANFKKALHWLGQEDAPLILRWRRWDPLLWLWLARFLFNCNSASARISAERIVRVSLYSRSCLQALRREVALDYDMLDKGIMHIYRDQAEFERACAGIESMQVRGLTRRRLSAAEAVALEPSLAAMGGTLLGGILTPDDESGDAFKFTAALAEAAARRGVAFRYDCPIHNLEWESVGDYGRISGVATAQGRLRADAYVLAMGSYSPMLARQVGLQLPIYPTKGYSATLPITDPDKITQVSLIDEEFKVVYSRLGDRLRVAGTAELAGWDTSLSPVRSRKLVERARALFPEGLALDKAELWAGLRPATPDSVPILGKTRIPNLFVNGGHGMLGWTMACGAGKVLADIVCGQPADIELEGLGADRFRSLWPGKAGIG